MSGQHRELLCFPSQCYHQKASPDWLTKEARGVTAYLWTYKAALVPTMNSAFRIYHHLPAEEPHRNHANLLLETWANVSSGFCIGMVRTLILNEILWCFCIENNHVSIKYRQFRSRVSSCIKFWTETFYVNVTVHSLFSVMKWQLLV